LESAKSTLYISDFEVGNFRELSYNTHTTT